MTSFQHFALLLLAFKGPANAFSPQAASKTAQKPTLRSSTGAVLDERPVWDPLGLYGKNSEERKQGKIRPLEDDSLPPDGRVVQDPLQLYSDSSAEVDRNVVASPSLPFLPQPEILKGVPGDRGFDPLNFSSDRDALEWYRLAELKHARLAMLATVGWFTSELLNGPLARAIGSPMLLDLKNRVPSVLNGGLGDTPPGFWASALGVAFAIETFGQLRSNKAIAGDMGFDPLNLYGKTVDKRFRRLEAELLNGRLAMLAITAFAFSEWWTQTPVSSIFS